MPGAGWNLQLARKLQTGGAPKPRRRMRPRDTIPVPSHAWTRRKQSKTIGNARSFHVSAAVCGAALPATVGLGILEGQRRRVGPADSRVTRMHGVAAATFHRTHVLSISLHSCCLLKDLFRAEKSWVRWFYTIQTTQTQLVGIVQHTPLT